MIKIRNYKASDYAQLKDNLKLADLYYDDMDSEALIARMIKKDSESIIIAEDKGRVIGSIYVVDMGFTIMLWRLNVIPDYRKRGISEQLLDEAKNRARKRGFTQAHGVVHEEHTRLIEKYQRVGASKGGLFRWIIFDL